MPPGSDGTVTAPVKEWLRTRQGARSGRGFHFQDAVGAWLASLVASAAIDAHTLVPEGFEDMSLEGDRSRHFQIESRVEKRGRFSVSDAGGQGFVQVNDEPVRLRVGQEIRLDDGDAVVVATYSGERVYKCRLRWTRD